MVRAPAPGTGGSRVRFLPGPRAVVARCNLHFLKQLAQSKLRRATCTEQLAQTNLHRQFAQSALPRATCAEQLAQSNLHRATCTEQLAQSNLQGAQLAQSNLQEATCRDQLASNLHRPVCAEHLAWCCLAPTCTHCNSHRATCAKQLAQSNLRMCQAGVKQVCRTSWGVMLSGHSPCRSLTQGVLIMKEVARSMTHTAYLRAWRTQLVVMWHLADEIWLKQKSWSSK